MGKISKKVMKKVNRRRRVKKCYKERDELLKQLGYGSYKEYLRSKLWQDIRSQVIVRDKHKCFICSGVGNEVHHTSYTAEVLCGEALGLLKCICRKCHESSEFKSRRIRDMWRRREKLPLEAVNNKMASSIARQRPCKECGASNADGWCQRCRLISHHGICSICGKEPPIRKFRNDPKLCYFCAKTRSKE